MKGLVDITVTSPQVFMNHNDSPGGDQRVIALKELNAKESSFITAVGYSPSLSISCSDWSSQVNRNKKYGNVMREEDLYVMPEPVLRNGSMV